MDNKISPRMPVLPGLLALFLVTLPLHAASIRVAGGYFVSGGAVTGTNLVVDAGATLAGTGTVHAAATIRGTVNPGYGLTAGTLAFSESVTFDNGIFDCYAASSASLDRLSATGTVSGVATVLMTRASSAYPETHAILQGSAGSDYSAFTVQPAVGWSLGQSGTLDLWVSVVPVMQILDANDSAIASGASVQLENGSQFTPLLLGTSQTNTFSITNSGMDSLVLTSYTRHGTDWTYFELAGVASVAAGAVKTFTVAYTPGAVGSHTTTVSFVSNDPAAPYLLNLGGSCFAVSTNVGPYAGGNTITITNGYFGSITNVLVGGVQATLGANGSNWFTIALPAATNAGPVDLIVQTSDNGTFATANAGTNIAVTAYMSLGGADVGNYSLSGQPALSADIMKAPQIISFTTPGTQFWSNSVGLSASAGSGLTVTLAVASGPASLTGGTNLSFNGYGTVVLTADQTGGTNTASFEFSFDGTNSPYTVNVVGVGPDGGVALSTNALEFTSTYSGTNPVPQTIAVTNVGGSDFIWTNTIAYSAGASNWLSILPAAGTVVPDGSIDLTNAVDISGIAAGSYTALVSIAADATNSPQVYVVSLTVARASQTISFTNPGAQLTTDVTALSATSGSSLPVVTLTVVSGPAVLSANIAPATATYSGAGEVTIVASQTGNSNWLAAASVTNTFTVSLGATAVHRFWSARLQSHFFTADEAEKENVIANMSDVYAYEGVAFYAYTQAVEGSLPVHRFWSPSRKKLFFTISEAEKAIVIANMSDIWRYEGIAWYAYPPVTLQPASTVQMNSAVQPEADTTASSAPEGIVPASAPADAPAAEVVFSLSYGDDTEVTATLYDPVTNALTQVLAPTLSPRELRIPAQSFGQRYWLSVLARDLAEVDWTLAYGGWLGKVAEVPAEGVETIDADNLSIGLPVEHIVLPSSKGTLSLLVYTWDDQLIETITGLEGGTTCEWPVPAWNQWYRLDIAEETTGTVLNTLWVGHLRTH